MKRKREPITAADFALMLREMGADHLLTLDLHNDSVLGFHNPNSVTVDHLQATSVAANWFAEEVGGQDGDVVVVAPHEGQVARANHFRSRLARETGGDVGLAFISKSSKSRGEELSKPLLVGDVAGKKVIVVDDIVSSGETMERAAILAKDAGAVAAYGYATHAIFSTPDSRSRSARELEFLLVSNTIYQETMPEGVKRLSVAPLVAEAIARVVGKGSVSDITK